MSIAAQILAQVRGLSTFNLPDNREDQQAQVNGRGDLIVTQALPELTELVRMG